jgi:hypothetical protein
MISKINLFVVCVVCVDSFPGVPQRIPYLPYSETRAHKKRRPKSPLLDIWSCGITETLS